MGTIKSRAFDFIPHFLLPRLKDRAGACIN